MSSTGLINVNAFRGNGIDEAYEECRIGNNSRMCIKPILLLPKSVQLLHILTHALLGIDM